MSDDKLHHPHDKLFKLGFSDPATAAAFLREQIPAAQRGFLPRSPRGREGRKPSGDLGGTKKVELPQLGGGLGRQPPHS